MDEGHRAERRAAQMVRARAEAVGWISETLPGGTDEKERFTCADSAGGTRARHGHLVIWREGRRTQRGGGAARRVEGKALKGEAALRVLNEEIVACRRCPRLVAHREKMAKEKRRAYRDWEYWGKPVPG